MQYHARHSKVSAQVLADGNMLVELDPPLCLRLDENTFEALFERDSKPRAKSPNHPKDKSQPPYRTVWELIQEALAQKPRSSAELFDYVTAKGKVTSRITIASILQAKRKAALVESPDQRGEPWQLTGGKS